MAKDLLNLVWTLEEDLRKSDTLIGRLKPKFTLSGSIVEGTRLGFANELDLGLTFGAWKDAVPFKVKYCYSKNSLVSGHSSQCLAMAKLKIQL